MSSGTRGPSPDSLAIALSGWNAYQKKLGNIANNLTNSQNPDFSQKRLPLLTNILQGTSQGVDVGAYTRDVDVFRVEVLRTQLTDYMYYTTLDNAYNLVDRQLGVPEDGDALGMRLAKIKQNVSKMVDSPEFEVSHSEVIRVLKEASQDIRDLGDFFQQQRYIAELGIDDAVKSINTITESIHVLNAQIAAAHNANQSTADYEDLMDSNLRELSKYIDVKILKHNDMSVEVYTKSGWSLVYKAGITQLGFTPATTVGPTDTAATLGQITYNGNNITSNFTSGKIGAYLQVRDNIMPNAYQAPLDQLAVQLRDTLNKVNNKGMGFPPSQTLTGSRAFTALNGNDPAVALVQMSGLVRIAVVDKTTGDFVGAPLDLDLTAAPVTVNAAVGTIDTFFTLAGTGTATLNASGQVVLQATSSDHGFAIVSLTTPEATLSYNATGGAVASTGLGFSHFFGLNDVLTTGSNYIQDGQPITGLAQTLDVRTDMKSNPSLVSRGAMYTGVPAAHYNRAYTVGDNSIGIEFQQAFDRKVVFPLSGSLSARTESVIDYANSIYHNHAVNARNAATAFEQNETNYQNTEKDLKSKSGVNTQEMIADLIDTQFRLAVLSKLIQTISQQFDLLKNM